MLRRIFSVISLLLLILILAGCTKQPQKNAILQAIKKGNTKVVQNWLNTAKPEELKALGPEALSEAIADGRKSIVLMLFNKGITFDSKQDSPLNPLNRTLEKGDFDDLMIIMRRLVGEDVPTADIQKMWNIFKGQKDLLRLKLLGYVDDHSGQDSQGAALLKAISLGDVKGAKSLIEKGANVNVVDEMGKTPLMLAADKGFLVIVIDLLSNGADLSIRDDNNLNALMYAIKGHHDGTASLLLDKAEPDMDEGEKAEVADFAKANGEAKVLSGLKKTSSSPMSMSNQNKPKSGTPQKREPQRNLGGAAPAMVLPKKIDPGQPQQSYPEQAGILSKIEKGEDLNQLDSSGLSPLMEAVQNNDKRVIILLLKHGAKVGYSNADGTTALMIASMYNAVEAVRILLTYGVDVNVRNHSGGTALMIASIYNNVAVMKELLAHGANVNAVNIVNQSALFYAVYQNQAAAVRLLLESGADKSLRDSNGFTALDWANRRGNQQMILLLQ